MSKLFIDPAILCLLMMLSLWPTACHGANRMDNPWQLAAAQPAENCFGDQLAKWSFQLTGPAAQSMRVQWQVTFERRVWQRGSLRVTTLANQAADVTFDFRAPPVAAGVIAGGILQVRLSDDQNDDVLTKEFPVWIFPENPFDTEFAWLKQLSFELVDPDRQLTKRLEELSFPARLAADQHKSQRVLLVAQAKEWDAAILQQIDQALRDGQRVLCLAATRGQLRLNAARQTTDPTELLDVYTANSVFIRQVDSRLSPAHLTHRGRFRLDGGPDDRISLSIQNNRPGWLFMEVGCDAPSAWTRDSHSLFTEPKFVRRPQLIYCGVDLMSRWSESPTPRYLLARLLERMCFESERSLRSKELP